MDEYATPPAARISSQTSEAFLMSRISIFAPSAARRIAAARPSPAGDTIFQAPLFFSPPSLCLRRLCGEFLLLKFSDLSVNRVQRLRRLKRMSARRDQHRGVVADLLRLSHRGDRPRSLFLLLAQSPLRRNLIEVIQQTPPHIGIGPRLEQHLVQLVSGRGRMLVKLKALIF